MPKLSLRFFLRLMNSFNNGFKRDASCCMRLRIEEYFAVAHILATGFKKIRPGEVIKILLAQQNIGPAVIDIQKRL